MAEERTLPVPQLLVVEVKHTITEYYTYALSPNEARHFTALSFEERGEKLEEWNDRAYREGQVEHSDHTYAHIHDPRPLSEAVELMPSNLET